MTRLACLLVLVTMLAGCRVDAVVEVDVEEDGSGVVAVGVSLDDEAVSRVGDLDEALALDDLVTADWRVNGPRVEEDGLTWVRASKPFATPGEFSEVMAEIGPLRDMVLERDHGFARTEWRVTGTIDLSEGLDTFGDDQLSELVGPALGFDIESLEAEIGPLAEAGSLRLVVGLPAPVDAPDAQRVEDDRAGWVISPGSDPVPIDARASTIHVGPLVAAGVTALLIVLLIGMTVRFAWRRVTGADRDEPLTPTTRPRAPERAAPDASTTAGEEPARERRLELIVVDAFGVLFRVHDDVVSVLAPFVVENGGTDDRAVVAERYREASLGRLSTAELWGSLGVVGEPDHLDHELVARVPLDEDALTFLERVKLHGLTVACLANGIGRWVELLRQRDSLDVYIDTWVVSSDVGVRKPDPAAFEALRRATGVPLSNCLMIDDGVDHLDSASREGMSTALFGPDDGRTTEHPRLGGFAELFEA